MSTDVRTVASNAIGLFVEYRDQHGRDEESARRQAIADVEEGAAADKAEPRPVMMVNVRVSDLGVGCAYPTRTYVIAASDTCQKPADTVVVERTGVRMYRCPKHRGMATPGTRGGVDVSEYAPRRIEDVDSRLWAGEPYPLTLPRRKAPKGDDAGPRIGDKVRYVGPSRLEEVWEVRRDRDCLVVDRWTSRSGPSCTVQEVRYDDEPRPLDFYSTGAENLRVVARATYTEVTDRG